MNETERAQMIEAVVRAVEHIYRYGNQHGAVAVALEENGEITVDVDASRHSDYNLLLLDDAGDVMGSDWYEITRQYWPDAAADLDVYEGRYRVVTERLTALFRESATHLVDTSGADLLAEARERVAE